MKITREFIVLGRSGSGGWNRRQVALLGLKWPLEQGWINRVVGCEISDDDAAKFIALKGKIAKSTQKRYAKVAKRREELPGSV